MKILIIVPAYNEEANIGKFIKNLQEHINDDTDILIINDCSTDNTKEILQKNNYNFLDLPINLGIGGAVQAGYTFAKEYGYDIAIQMDGDGQHKPEYINKLVEPIIDGSADITIGSRFKETKDTKGFKSSFMRRLGIKYLSTLIYLFTNKKIYDVTSGFRAVNRRYIALYANQYAQDYPEPEAIVTALRNGAKVVEIPVIMQERLGGKSSINFLRSIYYMVKVSMAIFIAVLHKKKVI